MAECGCGAQILWAETEDGKRAPFDREPDPSGNRVLLGRGPSRPPLAVPPARVVMCPDDCLYVSHFATCPDAAAYRRR